MRMRNWVGAVLIASVTWMSCDDDDDNNNNSLSEVDENFIENAALNNLAEVELGQIAASKGTDSLVRAFGQQMVTEHDMAQDELQQIADDFNRVDWPEGLDQQHQQLRTQLLSLSGYEFDSTYMASQVMDHQKAVTLFETEVNGGREQRTKAYANKYLPHIRMHYQRADSIQTVVRNSNNQINGD